MFNCFTGFNSSTYSEGYVWWSGFKNVILGKKMSTGTAFSRAVGVETIRIDSRATIKLNGHSFYETFLLKAIIFPKNTIINAGYIFTNCNSLKSIIFPCSVSGGGNMILSTFYSLRKLIIPNGAGLAGSSGSSAISYSLAAIYLSDTVTEVNSSMFKQCYNLKKIRLSKTMVKISVSCFESCQSLENLKLPNNIASFEGQSFYGRMGSTVYDFTEYTEIPTLGNYPFSYTYGLKIVVPDDLYDSWIAATGWSTYASYIVKESEYDS